MGKIATEREAYNIGNEKITRFETNLKGKKLVTVSRTQALGCDIDIQGDYDKYNKCVQLEDLYYANGVINDDAWIWYLELNSSNIFTWDNALNLHGDGSNWTNFRTRVLNMEIQTIGTYLCYSKEQQSTSDVPFIEYNSYNEPFNLFTSTLHGECVILEIGVSCSDKILALAGFGGHGNDDGKCKFTLINTVGSGNFTKEEHYINIRRSDGQMDDNFLSDDLLLFARVGTTFVTGYGGYGEEFTTVGIPINDTKASIMTYSQYKSYESQGIVKNVSNTYDRQSPSANLYCDASYFFPPSVK